MRTGVTDPPSTPSSPGSVSGCFATPSLVLDVRRKTPLRSKRTTGMRVAFGRGRRREMAIEEGSTPHQATGAGPEPQVPSENIDRRTGAERRIAQLQVDEERRVAERRAAKHESLARRRYTIDRVTHFVDYLFYLLY